MPVNKHSMPHDFQVAAESVRSDGEIDRVHPGQLPEAAPISTSLQTPLFHADTTLDVRIAASLCDIANGAVEQLVPREPLTDSEETDAWTADPLKAFESWTRARRAASRQFSEHSVRQYVSMFGLFLKWLAEHREPREPAASASRTHPASLTLAAVSTSHIQQFLNAKAGRRFRQDSSASNTTRTRYLRLIAGVFDRLCELGIVKANPTEVLLENRTESDFLRPAPMILSMDQMTAYIDTVSQVKDGAWVDTRDKALRLLFLASGITVHELKRLRRDDLAWGADPRSLVLRVAPHAFVQARNVPVASFALNAVQAWADKLAQIAPLIERLFPARFFGNNVDRPKDAPISSPECYVIVQETLKSIGYRSVRQGPQTLRNSFVARQIWHGRDKATITKWLGLHTTETVTKIERLVPIGRNSPGPA